MSLQNEYRPTKLSDFFGNADSIQSLKNVLSRKDKPAPAAFLIIGPGGCLHGDTEIYDPKDKSYISVKERCEIGLPFHVISSSSDGNLVEAEALPPVKYFEDRMFRVETSESVFFVTHEHRFLLSNGEYQTLKELYENGYDSVRLPTTSGIYQEVQPLDELHYSKIAPNFQGNYHQVCHFCGEPLLSSLKNDQVHFPLQGDVQTHTPDGSYLGDRLPLDKHNHSCQQGDHLSKKGFVPQKNPSLLGSSCEEEIYVPASLADSNVSLYHIASCPQCGVLLSLNHPHEKVSLTNPSLSSFRKFLSESVPPSSVELENINIYKTSGATIKNITEVVKEVYYDFHVPIYENYWMGGVFHHNCGKTTLGRIIKKALKCSDADFKECNSSDDRGIDGIRKIIDGMKYSPLNGPTKVYLLDEAHMLTKPSQEALLKALEEPPSHVHFIICTTNPEALKDTFKRRCHIYEMERLNTNETHKLLKSILEKEKVTKFKQSVLDKIVELADGSAGQALKLLDMVIDMTEETQALNTLKTAGTSESEVIDICRTLCNFKISNASRWAKMRPLLKDYKGDGESARRPILGYLGNVLINGDDENVSFMMDQFSGNFFDSGIAGLKNACFKAVMGVQE